jgi:hypothetical protein
MRKKKGELQMAHGTGFFRMCTISFTSMKIAAAKPPEIIGAIPKPANIAPKPLPLFQPHSTFEAPTVATPTPATAEIREYVDDTWAECLVHHMTHEDAAARAQVKASIWTLAFSRNAELGMMLFLIVSAVREPTVMAPSISNIVPRTIACLYVIDRDETLVAQEFATSSTK